MSERFPRPLTSRERECLAAIIRHASAHEDGDVSAADRGLWLDQVAGVMVEGRCGCGTCPTIDLRGAKGVPAKRIVLSARADGLGLLLFIDDGQLSSLEGFPLAVGHAYAEFPARGIPRLLRRSRLADSRHGP